MNTLTFSNIETAFAGKSTIDLKKARLLFKTMSKPGLVKAGNVLLNIALKLCLPVKWAIKPTIYKYFVGGENILDCDSTVEKLSKYKVKSILDYSVEGKESDNEIESAFKETRKSIDNAAKNPNIPFAVFKPTAFGKSEILMKASEGKVLNTEEEKELVKFKNRIDVLCKTAWENDIPVLIDAEDSWFQDVFDIVIHEMMQKYNKKRAIVYNTLQMYRWDRLDFLKKNYQKAKEGNYFYGAKFVRGAYMEKERERAIELGYNDPIQPDKESTDRDFNAALKFSVEHIDRISIFNGTHNEYSSMYLTKLMEKHEVAKNDSRIFFSQLYGMSDNISFNLAAHGFNVAKYVPYGPVRNVMPYLIRRAEENTSVKGQTGRELSLILQEVKRRKVKK